MSKPKLKSKTTAKVEKSKESLGKSIMESAQQIWLAGLGAFSKAQEEGNKLFENLVKEGTALEQKTRHFTSGKVEEMRGVVETGVSQVKERTQETWDKLEKVFEDRVSRSLGSLGVPSRKELQDLISRVDALSKQINKTPAKAPPAASAKPAAKPAAKSAAKPAANKTPRKSRDDLADLAKDLEDAQLAAKKTAKPASTSARKTAKSAPKK